VSRLDEAISVSITIRINTTDLTKNLDALATSQVPFATARALTQTGLDSQKAEQARIAALFTLRRPDFVQKQGVKLMGGIATKAKPSITFRVDPKADFLIKFETGAEKKPTGGEFLALPTDVRKTKRDLITASNRPRSLISRLGPVHGAGGVFVLRTQHGKLVPGIYQRGGRGARKIKLLFAFERDALTPKLLGFVDTFSKTVQQRWQINFTTALADAIKTAR
jgi:hypothetical protein